MSLLFWTPLFTLLLLTSETMPKHISSEGCTTNQLTLINKRCALFYARHGSKTRLAYLKEKVHLTFTRPPLPLYDQSFGSCHIPHANQRSIYVRFFNLKRPFSPFNVVFEVTVLYYICIHKYLFRYRTYTISQDLQIDTAAIVPYLPSCNIMIFLVVCSLIWILFLFRFVLFCNCFVFEWQHLIEEHSKEAGVEDRVGSLSGLNNRACEEKRKKAKHCRPPSRNVKAVRREVLTITGRLSEDGERSKSEEGCWRWDLEEAFLSP